MKKLFSLLIAAVFALSSGFAVAASHAGAQPAKKDEMKKDGDKKAAKKAPAKKDAKAAKKDTKAAKKDEAKK